MRSSRLTLALNGALPDLPESGDIVVLRPRTPQELAPLPISRLRIVQGFRPDHDTFAAAGYRCFALPEDEADLPAPAVALVCLPRSRHEAHALLHHAARRVVPGGMVLVDGQKTDGIESILKELRKITDTSPPFSKAHGKLFIFRGQKDLLPDTWQAQPRQIAEGFVTYPGVFSADGPDPGSALLAGALPEKLDGEVIDLGAGWGYLSRAALARDGVRRIHLVEAEAAAVKAARENVTDPRAQFHWADAQGFKLPKEADHVICNPPFHNGRDADPNLGLGFLRAAARLLAPNGTLWLVANRHLPYDRALAELFRESEEIGGNTRFRLCRAARPIRPKA
ncbi:MAG: class I SAM-dependent methyltransferase [Pseudorhodobacter sp.]